MKTACHYAIVRFMPFVETGEFANVGVVLFAPNARYFGFKLLGNRYSRVTHFFEKMDAKVFRAAMHTCKEELERIDRMLKLMGTDRRFKELDREGTLALWNEVIKPRETMLQFSESRLVLADSAQAKVRELFEVGCVMPNWQISFILPVWVTTNIMRNSRLSPGRKIILIESSSRLIWAMRTRLV
jgi:hypothetical protein